jgi:hypothetical protein
LGTPARRRTTLTIAPHALNNPIAIIRVAIRIDRLS